MPGGALLASDPNRFLSPNTNFLPSFSLSHLRHIHYCIIHNIIVIQNSSSSDGIHTNDLNLLSITNMMHLIHPCALDNNSSPQERRDPTILPVIGSRRCSMSHGIKVLTTFPTMFRRRRPQGDDKSKPHLATMDDSSTSNHSSDSSTFTTDDYPYQAPSESGDSIYDPVTEFKENHDPTLQSRGQEQREEQSTPPSRQHAAHHDSPLRFHRRPHFPSRQRDPAVALHPVYGNNIV